MGYLEEIFLLGISLLKNFPALRAGEKKWLSGVIPSDVFLVQKHVPVKHIFLHLKFIYKFPIPYFVTLKTKVVNNFCVPVYRSNNISEMLPK